MKKKRFLMVYTVLLMSIFACSFLSNIGQPAIPEEALAGIKPGTARIIGHFRLSDWAEGVSPSLYATAFEGTSQAGGGKEIRVFINDGDYSYYAGALADQVQLAGVKTIFLDFGTQRCIIGWVSPATPGKLLNFHIERPQDDPVRWMDAVLESTIEKNLFIVPIRADASPELWNTISMAAVQTRESLQRGFDGTGSYYEIEKTFSPPLDVSIWLVFIPLQK